MNRWRVAQSSERQAWLGFSRQELDALAESKRGRYVPDVIHWCQGYAHAFDVATADILQIGCAAVGSVHFYPRTANRFAIDPLADFFRSTFPEYVDSAVGLIRGVGEHLPYPNGAFDLVVLENVLDHCSAPVTVIEEVSRVLRVGGLAYVSLHFYGGFGHFIRKAIEYLHLPLPDEAHPHHFNRNEARELFGSPFHVVAERVNSFRERRTWRKPLKAGMDVVAKQELEFVLRRVEGN